MVERQNHFHFYFKSKCKPKYDINKFLRQKFMIHVLKFTASFCFAKGIGLFVLCQISDKSCFEPKKSQQSNRLIAGFPVGVSGFEPPLSRPPDAHFNRTKLHPVLSVGSRQLQFAVISASHLNFSGCEYTKSPLKTFLFFSIDFPLSIIR